MEQLFSNCCYIGSVIGRLYSRGKVATPLRYEYICIRVLFDLTRFNKIAIQGTPQMALDKEAICLSRVYSYYYKCNPLQKNQPEIPLKYH